MLPAPWLYSPGAGRAKNFSGAEALALHGQCSGHGPRPDGSPAIAKLRTLIKQQLAMRGCEIVSDRFTAQTPDGPVPMENIIAKFPGNPAAPSPSPGITTHKKMANFVGANDGGSSTGFLLELAAALQGRPAPTTSIWSFSTAKKRFTNGRDTDSVYGSRHLAEKWTADGTNRTLKALINVDMIGDRNLRLM